MALITWGPKTPFALTARPEAPEHIVSPWVVALEALDGATHLRITAERDSLWMPLPGLPDCGPDGFTDVAVPDSALVLKGCPPGALIVRIGGSSALVAESDADADEIGKPFAIGHHCVVKAPTQAIGPLFLGFNILYRPVRVKRLSVSIATGRVQHP